MSKTITPPEGDDKGHQFGEEESDGAELTAPSSEGHPGEKTEPTPNKNSKKKDEAASTTSPKNDNSAGEHELTDQEECITSETAVTTEQALDTATVATKMKAATIIPCSTCTSSSAADEGLPETWINAESLYRCIAASDISYESWTTLLYQKLKSAGSDSQFGLTHAPGGKLSVNLDLADSLTKTAKKDLIGVIARIVIDEARFGPNSGNPEPANDIFYRLGGVNVDNEWVVAESIHKLLEVEVHFDCWITQLSRIFRMEYCRDYESWDEWDQYVGESIPPSCDKDGFTFSFEFATKVAMATPTRRGALIRMFIEGAQSA